MVSERAAGFISGTLVAVIALFTASVFPRLMVSILPQPQFVASDGTPMSSKPRVSTASNAEAKARQDAAWDNPCPFLKTAWSPCRLISLKFRGKRLPDEEIENLPK